jgi:GT2 family glycosyltransferase
VASVLCSIATRGRYQTTLPLALNAIINQTKLPDKLVIFDDNDEPEDVRNNNIYQHLFSIMDYKGIKWEWVYAAKKGQHHIHQSANRMGYDWVWRVDDDAIPEPNVLAELYSWIDKDVGAIGGAILTLPINPDTSKNTGKIEDIDKEPNIQWAEIKKLKEVEHLHCSFLYRAGVHDYNLGLSRVAHREETLFTYGLYLKGYKILAASHANTWHLKNPQGGIRSETNEQLYKHDELIFRNTLAYKDKKIVVLNCGMGDHIVFKRVMADITNAEVFTCYPEIVPGRPISEAMSLFGDIDQWSIYKKMAEWKWTDSLENAFRKLYL